MAPFVKAEHQLVIEVFVSDLKRSLDFYRQLGFQLARQETHFAALSWESHRFFLDERPEMPAASDAPAVNVRILVPDVDRFWELALEMKARIVTPIGDRYYGLRDFIMTDPDGVGLRFASPMAAGEFSD